MRRPTLLAPRQMLHLPMLCRVTTSKGSGAVLAAPIRAAVPDAHRFARPERPPVAMACQLPAPLTRPARAFAHQGAPGGQRLAAAAGDGVARLASLPRHHPGVRCAAPRPAGAVARGPVRKAARGRAEVITAYRPARWGWGLPAYQRCTCHPFWFRCGKHGDRTGSKERQLRSLL